MISFNWIENNMVIPKRNCNIFLSNNWNQFDLKEIHQIRRNHREFSQSKLHLYDWFIIYHERQFEIYWCTETIQKVFEFPWYWVHTLQVIEWMWWILKTYIINHFYRSVKIFLVFPIVFLLYEFLVKYMPEIMSGYEPILKSILFYIANTTGDLLI